MSKFKISQSCSLEQRMTLAKISLQCIHNNFFLTGVKLLLKRVIIEGQIDFINSPP